MAGEPTVPITVPAPRSRGSWVARWLGLRQAVEDGPPPLGPGAPPRERLLAFLSAVVDVVYSFWHGHIGTLIAAERPDLDAPLLADLLLAGLQAEPILRLLDAATPPGEGRPARPRERAPGGPGADQGDLRGP
ncbi:MAG TPA: hypothetical protein VGP26_15660 [Actinophytocola sp.]|nr:hypothetical protein [Actinophytocola sp.]